MKDQNNVLAGPTPPESRMLSLDLLRGFSFLGILLVDVQLFAMPKAASLNPLAYGDFTGMNRWIWMVTHIVADQKFLNLIAATGRMSLTNYLLTSVMGAILFYGLGWYGKTERVSQMIMVLVLWVAWSAFSVLWLKHYRYGPLEWLWRSLTYRKWLANKK